MHTPHSKAAAGTHLLMAQGGHEQVVYGCLKGSFQVITAIHSTQLGPSLGGVRIWNYNSEREALTDALRLSRGMTYKAALAKLRLGGGKSVIVGDGQQIKKKDILEGYGKFVERLNGRYITAPDVGTNIHDMEHIANTTRYVQSLPCILGGSGDPSVFTAYGTYMGLKAAVQHVYGTDSLQGKVIGVEGVGKVGGALVEHLLQEKAKVYVTDTSKEQLARIAHTPVHVVSPQSFHNLPFDVYAPCALGATLNTENISKLQCKIEAGAANNQLEDEAYHGRMLHERGVTYVPDFLVNAGGLINIHTHMHYAYSKKLAYQNVERIYLTTLEVLQRAQKEQLPSAEVANIMAEEVLLQHAPKH